MRKVFENLDEYNDSLPIKTRELIQYNFYKFVSMRSDVLYMDGSVSSNVVIDDKSFSKRNTVWSDYWSLHYLEFCNGNDLYFVTAKYYNDDERKVLTKKLKGVLKAMTLVNDSYDRIVRGHLVYLRAEYPYPLCR